jgi:hypothetical protein
LGVPLKIAACLAISGRAIRSRFFYFGEETQVVSKRAQQIAKNKKELHYYPSRKLL